MVRVRSAGWLFAWMALLGGCSSGGSGSGAATCTDGGVCPAGTTCSPSGVCVTTSAGGSGGGGIGGSSATGGSGGVSPICQQVCARLAEAQCPNDPGTASCEQYCDTQRQLVPSCIGAYDALGSCELGQLPICNASGQPVFDGNACASAQGDYITCTGANTGGSGGAGASGGFGASGGIGATGGTGATGGFGATGGTGATGGFGATGGTGGTSACSYDFYGLSCSQVTTGNASCDDCATSYCCTDVDTCTADATCSQFLHCYLSECAGTGDPFACMNSAACSPCGAGAYGATPILTCLQTYCPSSCASVF